MDNYKREIAFILFRRWPIIVATAAAVTMLAVFVVLFWPRTYGAEGSLLIKGSRLERAPEALEDTQLRTSSVSEEDLISQVAILTSRELMRRTVEDLKAEGMGTLLSTLGSSERSQARKLVGSVEARVVPTSNVIRVTFTHNDRTTATILLSAIFKNFITYQQEVFSPQTVSSFLSDQMRRFQADLRIKNTEMADLIESTGLTSVELQIEQNLVLKRELQSQLNQAETEALSQSALIQRIDDELNSNGISLFTFVENLGIASLSDKLQVALVERADLARRYRPDGTPAVSRYDSMIEDLYAQLEREVAGIRDETEAQYRVSRQRINDLQRRIGAIDTENVGLRTSYLKLKEMEREAEILQTSYETFFRRNEEAIIQTSGGSGFVTSYVSLVQPPTAMDSPVFPQTLPILAAGIFAGVFLGLTLGLFAELQDHTLKRPEEIERRLGIPILFSVSDIDAKPAPKISRELLLFRVGLIVLLIIVIGIVWRLVSTGQDLETDAFQVDPTEQLMREQPEITPLPPVDIDGSGTAQRRIETPEPVRPAPQVRDDSLTGTESDSGAAETTQSEVELPPTSLAPEFAPAAPDEGPDVARPDRAAYYLMLGSVVVELPSGSEYSLEVMSSDSWSDLEPYLATLENQGFAARVEDLSGTGAGPFSVVVETFASRDEAEIIRSELISGLNQIE